MQALSILQAATEVPARVALVASGCAWTYADLSERVRRAISWLQRRGIRPGPGARVALVPRLDLETVVTILALVELGVPIVLLHPRLTDIERDRLAHDAQPTLQLWDVATAMKESLGCHPSADLAAQVSDNECLAILYTSGTTGRPKGAMVPRRAFLDAARASTDNLGWIDDDRWLLCMPLAHVGGLSILTRCLIARRCVVLPEAGSGGFNPAAIRAVIERDRVTLCSFVPTMLKRMLHDAPEWSMPGGVRAVLLGGAATPARLLAAARERSLPVLTTYGLTEACSQVTTQRYGTPASPDPGSGEPVAGTQIRIVDDCIEVRSRSLMTGYFPAEAHPNPFTADGWFRTGDHGRIDEQGRLHVLGRTSELIVTGGENVYPAEVERELELIPGIRSCCVFGVPDETWGQIVCAAITASDADTALFEGFGERVAATLAPHKRPRRIAVLEDLPMTAAGKLDRSATAAAAVPRLRPVARR